MNKNVITLVINVSEDVSISGERSDLPVGVSVV